MYSEVFVRSCSVTPAYYSFTRNNCNDYGYTNYSNSGYDEGYSNHSDSCSDFGGGHSYSEGTKPGGGCYDCYQSYHSESCSDSGCSDHYDSCTDSYHNDYTNYSNCFVRWSYGNYSDASNPSTGIPIHLSWGQPSLSEGAYLKDSIEALEEIQNNINYLIEHKGRNSITNEAAGTSIPHEGIIDSSTRDTLADSITELTVNLTGNNPNLNKSDIAYASEIRKIRESVDNLANMSINYLNYVDASWNPNKGGLPTEVIPSHIVQGPSSGGTYKDYSEIRYS